MLRVQPEHVLEQIGRLCELAGMREALAAGSTTILKDNISWHFPFPARQHDARGSSRGRSARSGARVLDDLVCVQNQTVVTDAFKGEDLNHYLPIFEAYAVPVLLQLHGRRT